jgi:hypothetical protein
MKRLFVAVGVFGLAVAAAARQPTPGPTPAGPAALVEQLGAESFADREAAAAALEKIGPPAIDALRLGTRSENPEVRDRAAVLLARLKRVADSNSRLAPKRVSLDYRGTPLGTAVTDFRARTGLNIALDPNRVADPLRKVTCEVTDVPVWEAFESFCGAAGLREEFRTELAVPKPPGPRRGYIPPPITPNADAVPLVLVDGKADRLPGARSTAVRVLALPATFPGHRVTLATGEITFAFDVTPAPGTGWQDVTGVKVNRVIDSAGRVGGAGSEKEPTPSFDPTGTVVFARPGLAMRFDVNGNTIPPETLANPRVVNVPIRVATPSARSLKRLEGSVFGEVQVPDQHLVTVTDPKRHTNETVGGPGELKFVVLEVKDPPRGGTGSVRVQLSYPSPWVANARKRNWNPGWPEPPQNPSQGNRVEAFDAAGKRLAWSSSGSVGFSDDGMLTIQTYSMTFRAEQGLPAKLVVVGPKIVTVEVPFVMENVPLP